MKKLFIILLIFISIVAYAKMEVIEVKYYDDQKIVIVCIDGYKYMIVNTVGSSSSRPASIIQMYEYTKIFSKVMSVSCK